VRDSHRVVEEVKQAIGLSIKHQPQSRSVPVELLEPARSARSAKKEDYQGSNIVYPEDRIYTEEEPPQKHTEPTDVAVSYLNLNQSELSKHRMSNFVVEKDFIQELKSEIKKQELKYISSKRADSQPISHHESEVSD
jgi:hypothetical protein